MSFTHLHVHSLFSDGAASPQSLTYMAKRRGFTHLALTDHNTLAGIPSFLRSAEELGITPVIGAECVVASHWGSGHLVLLCGSSDAYDTLSWYLHWRLDRLTVRDLAKIPDLYATSSCLGGLVAGSLKREDYWTARDTAVEYQEAFGPRYVLEAQPTFGVVLPWILSLGRDLAIPVVATNDVHYLGANDIANQVGLHLATEEEMRSYSPFTGYQGALENAHQIAQTLSRNTVPTG